jgi:hypothetical protein
MMNFTPVSPVLFQAMHAVARMTSISGSKSRASSRLSRIPQRNNARGVLTRDSHVPEF